MATNSALLRVSSLLSILLMSFHLTEDMLGGGMSQGGIVASVLILVTWLYGTVVLTERGSGYLVTLLGSVLGAGVVVVHLPGLARMAAGETARTAGSFFFAWTLLGLAVTATFTAILSLRGLGSLASTRRP